MHYGIMSMLGAAVQALAAAGEEPWMYLVLAPLAQHRVPPFRAWSGGRAAGVRGICCCCCCCVRAAGLAPLSRQSCS